MSSSTVLILILALSLAEFLTAWLLDVLNLNSILKHRKEVPEFFRDGISLKIHEQSTAYSLKKGKLGLLEKLWGLVFFLVLILSAFPGRLESFLAAFIHEGRLFSIAYTLIFYFLYSLSEIPGSLYSRFVIEEEFGFNKTSLSLLIKDTLKGILVSLLASVPLLAALFWFMDKSGAFWWLYASAFITLFQLVLFLIYPVLIAPLFNKFKPLEEGSLKTRLLALAEKCGFETRGIFVMDGSRRSGHSNAYFTGMGKMKRIVLFDTLVDALTEEELEGVLAHEIGHYKLKHIPKQLLLSVLTLTGALFAASLAMKWEALFQAFGFYDPGYHSLLIIILFCSSPLAFFFSPLGNSRSRKYEYQADAYACRATGNGEALSRALLALSRDNLSNLTPHRAYSFFHYSHPALSERLDAIKRSII